jgi:DNA polymerase-1
VTSTELATRPMSDVQVRNAATLDGTTDLIEWARARAHAPLAVDTETTGLRYLRGDRVRLFQIGDANTGWALPFHDWRGLIQRILELHEGPIDMANAKFDFAFLDKEGVRLDRSRIRDVGVAAHINEPHMSRGLKNQATRHVDPAAGAASRSLDEAMKQGGWDWDTVPFSLPLYWAYGALDTVLTRRVADYHIPIVTERSPVAWDVESAFQWVALEIERNGAHVDVEYARVHYEKFTQYCENVERWVQDEYGVKAGSNQAVVSVLERAGFTFTKATKTGAVALDAEVLEGIDHPLAQQVLMRRRLQKIASTYLRFYVENADESSLIHPSINTLGARTGRMSMEEPNLQNLPVRGGHGGIKIVRNCITARPGHRLLMCDFDQIEMRLLAAFCGDPGLLEAFLSPEDFFVVIARNIFGDAALTRDDPRRQPTKNSMYAKIYGAGIAKQAATAGVSVDQMRFVNRSLNASYPGIESYASKLIGDAVASARDGQPGYTTCPITGRRHYADRGKEYALVNYAIQGAAAVIFKMKLLELDAAGLGPYMVAPVHDEIILDVPEPEVRDAVHALQKIMNDDRLLSVPITASVSHGYRWGEKQPWTEDEWSSSALIPVT